MNRFLTTIAMVMTLAIAQGCTQLSTPQKDSTVTTTTQPHSDHTDHAVAATSHTHDSHPESHRHSLNTTQATLTTFGRIYSNIPASLQIDVQDNRKNPVTKFDRFQEQIMHLIAVSDDLQTFQHLHPTYKGNGRFEVQAQFPQSGNYTLFSDYQPTGQAEQVSVLKTTVDGTPSSVSPINWSRTKTFDQTIVSFAPTKTPVKAGENVILRFNLQDATTQQAIADLQPYLGEKGHLVILRQSPTLTREDYIHAHAVPNTPASQIHFATRFPQPGNYKIWGQFNRDGEIVTADYGVEVVR